MPLDMLFVDGERSVSSIDVGFPIAAKRICKYERLPHPVWCSLQVLQSLVNLPVSCKNSSWQIQASPVFGSRIFFLFLPAGGRLQRAGSFFLDQGPGTRDLLWATIGLSCCSFIAQRNQSVVWTKESLLAQTQVSSVDKMPVTLQPLTRTVKEQLDILSSKYRGH